MQAHRYCKLPLTALLVLTFLGCGPQAPEHDLVIATGDEVRIPLPEVDDGQVHFYSFLHQGKRVNFLVRKDRKGHLQAHLDACFSCYRYRLGFIIEGTELVCIACRYAYDIGDEVWDYIGACAPISIRSTSDETSLIIPSKILERAARYF